MTRKAVLLVSIALESVVRQTLMAAALLVGLTGAQSAELPLARIVLSNSGLAQFTHAGTVTPGASVDLAVRLDQVDDILKSLTVFDKEGAIGAVSLPGKAPLVELFRDLPFGEDALASPTALLNALVGTDVEITGKLSAKGRIFRVETEETALANNGGTTRRHRLTLMTDNGLVQAVIEDIGALRFTDPQAKAQVERALAGLAANRAKERRRLSIGFLGTGTRQVAISYVVAAPVWKTAYRLVLPKDGTKARLQGWAVLENLTGGDWKDVDLVLVSGNPVALRQPLYTAFFTDRPEVAVTTAARLVPRTDDAEEQDRARPSQLALGRQASAGGPVQHHRSPAQRWRAGAGPATRRDPSRSPGGICWIPSHGHGIHGRRGGGGNPAALPIPGQGLARDRAHDDGAVRGPGSNGDAHLALSARHLRTTSARSGAPAQRRRQRPARRHRHCLR